MATYGSELARVNLIWTPNASAWPGETAVCGFWLHHEHVTGVTFNWDHELQFLADKVADKLADHWGSAPLAGLFGSGYQVSEIRAAQIGTDGREVNAKTSPIASGTCAGSGSKCMPPETALVLSFYGFVPGTFTSHPGRKRGRMYLPYINAAASDAQGKVAGADDLVSRLAIFFNDIQGMHADDEAGLGGGGEVFDSWSLVTASATGEVHQVERLVLDDHFDSQRRRQHQSPAVKSLATIDH